MHKQPLRSDAFRLGINYWPARTAMGWWRDFEPAEVATDFMRIAAGGFDSVRLFLTWEDFQPEPSRVDSGVIARLITTLDEAAKAGLAVMPTLFTGHMSGINWIPPWALDGQTGDERFRVIADGKIEGWRIASWYEDDNIVAAQATLARELAAAVAGHSALWAWDLGNENSNCSRPSNKASARSWLLRMTDAIRGVDSQTPITLGLHMEDLEQDRNLGPREAAEACDFLTMHGYPGYASWTAGATDERLLPFLTRLTQWLGGEVDVLFSEFGVPTVTGKQPDPLTVSGPALVTESAAAAYTARALNALLECGSTGAMLWCYSDYDPALWSAPPFDRALHERSFGLWRADGSPKPAVAAVQAFAAQGHTTRVMARPLADDSWLDIDQVQFYRAPAMELPRLYMRYCTAIG